MKTRNQIKDHKKSKEMRIAVVGGGASGLTAAYRLKQLGYNNITVFEKEKEPGGKVKTFSYEGRKYEMGAIILSKDYKVLLSFARQLGLKPEYTSVTGTTLMVDESDIQLEFFDFLKRDFGVFRTARAFIKYFWLLRKYKGLYSVGFSKAHPDLNMTFSEFAVKHKIEPVSEALRSVMAGLGYGYYEEVPAIYVMKLLKWLFFIGLSDALNSVLGTNLSTVQNFPDGFQKVWIEIAKEVPVKLNSKVTKIQRKKKGDGYNITITANGKNNTFDHVIISTPPRDTLRILDTTPEEKNLLKKVTDYKFRVAILRIENLSGDALYLRKNCFPHRIGHTTVINNPFPEVNVFVAYQLVSKDMTKKEINAKLTQDIKDLGGKPGQIIKEVTWNYFPHVKTEDLHEGFYHHIDNLQGERGTYFIGSLMNFETVEHTSEFAFNCITEYFG